MFLVLPIDSLVFCLLAQERRERGKKGGGDGGGGGLGVGGGLFSALAEGARGLNEQQKKKRKYILIKL